MVKAVTRYVRSMSNLQRKWLQWSLVLLAVFAALAFVVLIPYAAFHIFYSSNFGGIPLPILIGLIVSLVISLVACGSLTMVQPREDRDQRLEAPRDEVDDVLSPMGSGDDAVGQEMNSPGQLPQNKE